MTSKKKPAAKPAPKPKPTVQKEAVIKTTGVTEEGWKVKEYDRPKEEPRPEIPFTVTYQGKEGGGVCSSLMFSTEGEICIHSKMPCPIAKLDIWRLCTVNTEAAIYKLTGQLRGLLNELSTPTSSLVKLSREVEALRLEMSLLREALEGMGGRF